MSEHPEEKVLSQKFLRELSIRRSVKLLEGKRKRIKEEIEQLITHISLLVPIAAKGCPTSPENHTELLQEAVNRLGDDAFAQLFIQILQELK